VPSHGPLLGKLPETILLVDKASRAMRVNQDCNRMFGHLQEEIIGVVCSCPPSRPAHDVSVLLAKLQALPLVLQTVYSHDWKRCVGQLAESTETLNISYVGASGE
jgi:hypothetical protein